MAIKTVDYKYEELDTMDEKLRREFIIKINIVKILQEEGFVEGDAKSQDHYFKYGMASKLCQDLYNEQTIICTTANLTNFISYNKSTCDYLVAIGICQMFRVNISMVLTQLIENIKDAYYCDGNEGLPNISLLTDTHYMGDFHGYTYSSNSVNQDIEHFTLSIKESNDEVLATYVFEDKNKFSRIFIGKPYIINNGKTVEIKLIDERGNVINLNFGYKRYNSAKMYFRTGIICTNSTTSDDQICKNFVLCKNEIPDIKVREYLPGLLKMTNGVFNVPQSIFEQFINNDPEIANILKSFELNFICRDSLITVDEDLFLNTLNKYDSYTQEKIISFILRLKGRAIQPNFIIHKTSGNGQVLLAHYVREYLFENTQILKDTLFQ